MLELLKALDAFVWGPPLLILLVGTGIYLTIRLGLLQVARLPKSFQLIFTKDKGHGDVSSFAALCTALAATVGTGNIIGVATAIKVGGPGALFWMWMAAFFGMATKYAEGLLAIKYDFIHFCRDCCLWWPQIHIKSFDSSCSFYGYCLYFRDSYSYSL